MKFGMLAAAGLWLPRPTGTAWSHQSSACPISERVKEIADRILGDAKSPCTRPFAVPMPIPPVQRPVPLLDPVPGKDPGTHPQEGRRLSHQQFEALFQDPAHPVTYYEVRQQQFLHSFHPDLPMQPIWGFNGHSPGPVYHGRYGHPIILRNWNLLPPVSEKAPKNPSRAKKDEFGCHFVSTHLHNGHTAPESDGNPKYFWENQTFYDQCYANRYAGYELDPQVREGFTSPGDPSEALGTLWYHDHMHDATAANVYKGLVGMFMLFDEIDSGNENDSNPLALRLPSGEYDVPILLTDKVFDLADGLAYFDLTNRDGIVGDKVLVNGVIQPYFQVARRKYRFRFVNAGPSRFYQLFLSNGMTFTQISNDGNLFERPIERRTPSRLGVAERIDVIIDFSKAKIGDHICLENRLRQTNGAKPADIEDVGVPLLRFDVVRDAPDPSRVPEFLRKKPDLSRERARCEVKRRFLFNRKDGDWTVNDRPFKDGEVGVHVQRNTSEIWTFKNGGGGWDHPIHVHHNEFLLLSRNGLPVSDVEAGRKDVVRLDPGGEVDLLMRFRDFDGVYPIHCHNVLHEDHAMMMMFRIQNESRLPCPDQDAPVDEKDARPGCRHSDSHEHP
jgi:FtsP/CotA-like multicopper oxidase with cupredoxin domain